MAAPDDLSVKQLQERLRVIVHSSPGPICVHDLARAAGRDTSRLGAALVVTALLAKMSRGGLLSKPTIGGAGVRARTPELLDRSPCDYYFWSLATGAPASPDGLAHFGPEWQGALLAMKVRAHAESFPPMFPTSRGPPKPDLTV